MAVVAASGGSVSSYRAFALLLLVAYVLPSNTSSNVNGVAAIEAYTSSIGAAKASDCSGSGVDDNSDGTDDDCMSEIPLSLLQYTHSNVLHVGASIGELASQISTKATADAPHGNCSGIDCLKTYVDAQDSPSSWNTLSNFSGYTNGIRWTGYIVNVTSISWLNDSEVNSPIWVHEMVVIVPANVQITDWCTLYLRYSRSALEALDSENPEIQTAAYIATQTAAASAVLFGVPPGGLVFTADPLQEERSEDTLVPYGWQRFSEHPDQPELLVELPMVKATVRTIDVLDDFLRTGPAAQLRRPEELRVALMGTSKRGAVAWQVAAIDARVKAIVPVARSLNLREYIHMAYRCTGGIPVAAEPYNEEAYRHDFLESSAGYQFDEITDPYKYDARYLAVDKLVISGTSDEFFMPDHTRLWWDEIPEPKVNMMVPNTGHIIGGEQLLELAPAIGAFIRSVSTNQVAPKIVWEIDNATRTITVRQVAGAVAPLKVELWQAVTCTNKSRDFRLHNNNQGKECEMCGEDHSSLFGQISDPLSVMFGQCKNLAVTWSSSSLASAPGDARVWVAEVDAPADGRWAAFFVRFEFDGPEFPLDVPQNSYVMSTEVSVVPDTFPFSDCERCDDLSEVL